LKFHVGVHKINNDINDQNLISKACETCAQISPISTKKKAERAKLKSFIKEISCFIIFFI